MSYLCCPLYTVVGYTYLLKPLLAEPSYINTAMSLTAQLKAYRSQRAALNKVSKFMIMSNKVITHLNQTRPHTLTGLRQIIGMTTQQIKTYGEDILRLIRKYSTPAAATQPAVLVVHNSSCTAQPQLKKTKQNSTLVPQSVRQTPTVLVRNSIDYDRTKVYILKLEKGYYYVGKTKDFKRRLQEHLQGHGSEVTRTFKPTGEILPRLGSVTGGSGEAMEREETLLYMYTKGIEHVRGWRYTQVHMSKDDIQDAENNIREMLDLCRRCGRAGHFITQCKHDTDRHGVKLKAVSKKKKK